MDTRSPQQRRRIIQSVKQKGTTSELVVRRLLHGAGYRYRLHRKGLPGRPDIVFGKRRKVILVHGCFWHAHGCSKGKAPKSKLDYWGPKLAQNVERDAKNVRDLVNAGWQVLTVWECETRDPARLLLVLRDLWVNKENDRHIETSWLECRIEN
ncbi:very short patch repair endonuclease [Paracoccus seriniphilus]|uniref:very short patch repair endonuclease n=1 Tax=Paracoccus seriniphilus TaxID=184748 RepID=UPI000B783181|nr:very short patch repair endonuclease [Paracoccus seriniphilus]WCR16593.1 DNA mismatch endonuclease Vsr [Paracoccus seriniphilus]